MCLDRFHHYFARGALCLGALLCSPPARAQDASRAPSPAESEQLEAKGGKAAGRPKVRLDRLTFPDRVLEKRYQKYLRRVLAREARRANWGATRGNTIEYRFAVEILTVVQRGSAIQVKCSAMGRLPKGKSARGHLEYGGDPRHQTKLVEQVLEIVARGVITRLAELERVRRGELHPERVRAPES